MRVPQALRGLRGPGDGAAVGADGLSQAEIDVIVGRTVAALLETQTEASRALAEGAIDEARYADILARADAIEAAMAADSYPQDFEEGATSLLEETRATRRSGGASHRSNVWLAMLGATIGSVLLIMLLTAWSYRGNR